MKSYDYAHRQGVRYISWDEFAELAAQLAEKLDSVGVEVIVGIARAGLIPATTVACNLRRELFPVRVTRRINDEVRYASPVWKVLVSPEVADKAVAVIDEMADTGETLALVAKGVREQGASKVITATLVSHSWASPPPAISALVTDELVIFPWDQQVFMEGHWQPHPEMVEAVKFQKPEGGD